MNLKQKSLFSSLSYVGLGFYSNWLIMATKLTCINLAKFLQHII